MIIFRSIFLIFLSSNTQLTHLNASNLLNFDSSNRFCPSRVNVGAVVSWQHIYIQVPLYICSKIYICSKMSLIPLSFDLTVIDTMSIAHMDKIWVEIAKNSDADFQGREVVNDVGHPRTRGGGEWD